MVIIRGKIGDIQPNRERPTLELTFNSKDRQHLPQGSRAQISFDFNGKVLKGTINSSDNRRPYVHTHLTEGSQQISTCTQVFLNMGLIEGAIIDFEILPDKILRLFRVVDSGKWRAGNEPKKRKFRSDSISNKHTKTIRKTTRFIDIPPDLIEDIESHKQEYESLAKTEQESIIKSRIGQGIFRTKLIELWGGCSVTGLSNLSLLRASHIKPWRDCSNQERLDPMNGLLLQPTLDHLFDSGFITFEDDGYIRISGQLSHEDMELLHITQSINLREMPDGLRAYLRYHREHVFKNGY